MATVAPLPSSPPPPPERCACGRPLRWSQMPIVGVQADEEGDLELRNCACGSTRARLITEARAGWAANAALADLVDGGPHPLPSAALAGLVRT